MTKDELLDAGMDVLFEKLGAPDAIRFLQIVSPGKGDFTAERAAAICCSADWRCVLMTNSRRPGCVASAGSVIGSIVSFSSSEDKNAGTAGSMTRLLSGLRSSPRTCR